MKTLPAATLAFTVLLALSSSATAQSEPETPVRHVRNLPSAPDTPPAAPAAPAPAAPAPSVSVPPPDGVTELSFQEIFHLPVGPLGLEYSDKTRSLDGKKVQLTGYMVNHVHADPRVFLFSPIPLKFHQCEFGLCDDLPVTAVHVFVKPRPGEKVHYAPGLLTLVGTLSIGNREEMDGRISTVRLYLDGPAPGQPAPTADATVSKTETSASKTAAPAHPASSFAPGLLRLRFSANP